MTYLDLDAIRKRSDGYLSLADRMDDDGKIAGLNGRSTAIAIGLAATLTAADVPDLLDEVYRLNATVEALNAARAGLDSPLAVKP